jgi:glutamate-5-semialdehyde dehydrogenase
MSEEKSMAVRAARAAPALAQMPTKEKRARLMALAAALERAGPAIVRANARDVAAARWAGLAEPLCDRLRLDKRRLKSLADGVRTVAKLDDPVGKTLAEWRRPNGLRVLRVSVPIGVIAVIYEARPGVTIEAACLCFMASNAVILRGGKEALRTNQALLRLFDSAGFPDSAVQLVGSTDRKLVGELVQLEGLIDLVVPRGGEGLVHTVTKLARVPVLKHYKGVCHVYVDASADLAMALSIVEDAKCQRPGVCNAMETLLVDARIAARFLPLICERLAARGVEMRGDAATRRISKDMKAATEEDWSAEYLDLIVSIRVVCGLDAAIAHVNRYGSKHTDAIVTRSDKAARRFCGEVDSAGVFVNASTRFHDGGEFGMGAEIGISTDKLHARGPMGLEQLTTYKYLVLGDGQTKGKPVAGRKIRDK